MTTAPTIERTVRVAVLEDDAHYRRGLESLIEYAPGFALAASHERAHALLSELERRIARGAGPGWDLLLTDLGLHESSGIEVTRRARRLAPDLPVVVLTVFEEPSTILEAICAGADGYLLKKTPPAELLAQLRAIVEGGSPLTPGVARSVLDLLRSGARPAQVAPLPDLHLSGREREVLRLLVRGLGYKQVAAELGVSIDTVRTYIRRIYGKLQVHSVAEAVGRAIRDRLV